MRCGCHVSKQSLHRIPSCVAITCSFHLSDSCFVRCKHLRSVWCVYVIIELHCTGNVHPNGRYELRGLIACQLLLRVCSILCNGLQPVPGP